MNSRHLVRNIASSICAAALACAAAGVPAQSIYKQVDDEGSSTFSDRPAVDTAAPVVRRGALVTANEAARRLKQAQLERKRGAEPRPGELTPGSGAVSVNYRYWQRQERLRVVVEQALRRSNETQRPLLAQR